MANIGELIATLEVDSSPLKKAEKDLRNFAKEAEKGAKSATKALEESSKAAESVGSAMDAAGGRLGQLGQAVGDLTGMFGNMGTAGRAGLLGIATAAAALVGYLYVVYKAVEDGKKLLEDQTITANKWAAALTNTAVDNKNAVDTYNQALAFTTGMYGELIKAATKYGLTNEEVFRAWMAFQNQGIVIQQQEVNQLAQIVSAYKSLGEGMVRTSSIAREVQKWIDGQASSSDLLARYLTRVGANWQEVAKQVQVTKSITPISMFLPGTAIEAERLTDTLTRQRKEIQDTIDEIKKRGAESAYEGQIALLKRINELLTEHKDVLIKGIEIGWWLIMAPIRALVAVVEFLNEEISIVKKQIDAIANMGNIAINFVVNLVGPGAELINKIMGGQEITEALSMGYGPEFKGPKYGEAGAPEAAETFYGPAPPPAQRPPLPWDKKAGKGARDTTQQIQNLIDTLEKEYARLAEGSLAEISRWYEDIQKKIEKYATTDAQFREAMELAAKVKTAKEQKVYEDFNKWYANAVHDRVSAALAEEQDLLKKFAGVYGAREAIIAATDAKLRQIQIDTETERLNLLKGYQSEMANLTPLLSDQVKYQQECLNLEKQLAALKLEELYLSGRISQETYDQAKAMQAVVDQAKQFALEQKKWMTEGVGGGLKTWALQRRQEAKVRPAQMTLETLREIEREFADGISAAIINAMRGRETDFSQIFFAMADSGIKRAMTGLTATIFDQFAGLIGLPALSKPDGTPGKPFYVAPAPGVNFLNNMIGQGIGGGMGGGIFGGNLGGFEYPMGFNPTEAGWGGWPIEGQEMLQTSATNFYNQQANWFTNLLGLTSAPQASLMTNTSGFYNQQTGFFQDLLGQLPGWLGKLGGVIGSLFDSLIKGIGGLFGGGGGGGFGGLFGGLFGLFGGGGGGVGAAGAFGGGMGFGLGEFGMLGLPLFQKGGFVRKPTFAMIGEGGAEWVIPDKKMKEMFGQDFTKNFANLLNIPAFSEGGYVTKPTLAMIGDRGPELAIPERKLNKIGEFVAESKPTGRGIGEGVTINSNIYIEAAEPSRFFSTMEQLNSKRVHDIRKALRNL